MDNAKYCSNSRGSCWETLDHLITAHDEGFITNELLAKGRELAHEAIKLINGYMNYLQKTAKSKSSGAGEQTESYGDEGYRLSVNSYRGEEPDNR
ncbi:hypothetical protein JCM31598_25770 [Desulfonatronum parangueonense]